MHHPYFMKANAAERYQALLQQAENRRRVKKLQARNPGLQTHIASRLGRVLITVGKKLKTVDASNVTAST